MLTAEQQRRIEQHKRDAARALVEAADYRQYVRFQADRLVDAVIPEIRAMVLAELEEYE